MDFTADGRDRYRTLQHMDFTTGGHDRYRTSQHMNFTDDGRDRYRTLQHMDFIADGRYRHRTLQLMDFTADIHDSLKTSLLQIDISLLQIITIGCKRRKIAIFLYTSVVSCRCYSCCIASKE